jgi:hypothetical protein
MLLRTFLSVVALWAITVATAHSMEVACPGFVVETPSVTNSDASWQVAAAAGERPLDHAGVYLGGLAQLGAQVPDSTRKKKNLETVTWRLRRAEGDQYWIGCSYIGTTALMVQKINSGFDECVASYELLPTGRRQRLKGVLCR